LARKSLGKRILGRMIRVWEDNIKRDPVDMSFERRRWMEIDQDRVK
jgi:hypothetical protein